MTYPTIFANLAGGTEPASLLDTMFNIAGNQGNIGCTASGTNAITLTPNTNQFLPTSYVNFQMVTFAAAATSTGSVTIQIGGIGFVNLYNANGVQSNAGDIAINTVYTAVFNSALNSGAGGFIVVSNTPTAAIPAPGGYLTLVSQTPIITSDTTVSAGSNIFYTPFMGATVPVFNGTVFVPTLFSELTLTLNAAHLASNIYDVFMWNNNGILTVVTGPSWSAGSGGSITAGSCARGTGAGGAALQRIQGFYTNAASMTVRNGANTFTMGANLGTYLASIFMDGTNGQLTCHRSYGFARKFGVWNAFNRAPIYLKSGDTAASWSYSSNTIRASNANTNGVNGTTVFTGLSEEVIDASFEQSYTASASAQASPELFAKIGIGLNSLTAYTGTQLPNALNVIVAATNASLSVTGFLRSRYFSAPLLGINNFQALEQTPTGAVVGNTFNGTEASMLFSTVYRG